MMALRLEKTGRRMRIPLFAVALVALWAALIVLFNVYVVQPGHADTPCMFKNVTGGVPCPTCGATRSALDVLHGDIGHAIWRNPLVVAAEVLIIVWVGVRLATGYSIRLQTTKTGRRWLWVAATVLFLANWVHVIAIDGPW